MFTGISMILWATLSPPANWGAEFLPRRSEIGISGLALALTSGFLRYGKKDARPSVEWPKPLDILFIFALALVAIATDIYFSSKIGLLAYPPYEDGVAYMFEAKNAFLQLGSWRLHPIHFTNMMIGNRYPIWQGLMVLNFMLFGQGEWQAYAVRFWPTFVILLAVF